jgi:hypothetical protein
MVKSTPLTTRIDLQKQRSFPSSANTCAINLLFLAIYEPPCQLVVIRTAWNRNNLSAVHVLQRLTGALASSLALGGFTTLAM